MTKHSNRVPAKRLGVAALLIVSLQPPPAHGEVPLDTPVERLVKNLGKFLAEHPNDADGHYRLGRVHMLALSTKTEVVPAWAGSDLPAEGSWAAVDREWAKRNPVSTPRQRVEHLTKAIECLGRALELRPMQPRYHLTLACTLEVGLPLVDAVDLWAPAAGVPVTDEGRTRWFEEEPEAAIKPDDVDTLAKTIGEQRWSGSYRKSLIASAKSATEPALQLAWEKLRRADWREQMERHFFAAMSFALPTDGMTPERPIWGDIEDFVAYEAASGFSRVVVQRPRRREDAIRVSVARAVVEAVKQLPMPAAITPIVLDVDGVGLDRLQASHRVAFDLDGTGRPLRWRWLAPNAGILVWDPLRKGRITSGRQLFGSASWWLFFADGYQALDALDDDRDGKLTGRELSGLAVWFDGDGDGVAAAGEVTPIERLGIGEVACRATSTAHGCLANSAGVTWRDGRVRASYDWVSDAEPAAKR